MNGSRRWPGRSTARSTSARAPCAAGRRRIVFIGDTSTFAEIGLAVREMPATMRRLWWMKLFQWYGMMCYWICIVPALAHSLFQTGDAGSRGFRDAVLLNGQLGGFYNAVAFVAAFAMMPFTRRFGAKRVHAVCLALAAVGMAAIPAIHDRWLLLLPMVGIGMAWTSILGNPYILLAGSIPPERAGVYMGIFNMFIVLPMLIQMLTLPLYYQSLLGGQPENVIRLAGALLGCAAVAVLFVKVTPPAATARVAPAATPQRLFSPSPAHPRSHRRR